MSNFKKPHRFSQKPEKLVPRDISESLGKLPPQAPDLEVSILGAIMLEKNAISEVVDILTEEDFYVEKNNVVYGAILDLYRTDEPIDMKTVVNQLRRLGKLEIVGGMYYIAEVTSMVSSAANIEYHARVVAEMAMKRRMIEAASVIHHESYEDEVDVFELLEKSQKSLDQIAGKFIRAAAKKGREIFEQVINTMIKAKKQDGLIGVPSSYTALDRLTGGFKPTDFIVIGGRPGMAKSSFVGCIAKNVAVQFKKPVAIFSLEMSSLQFMQRMVSAEAEVELDHIIHGTYEDYHFQKIGDLTSKLAAAPIFIDDTAGLSILELRAKARRMKAEHGIELIIIDYLQLMKGDKEGNREQEIASISRALKILAKELQIPVIAIVTISRACETRGGDKRPQLSDIRESGSIDFDADLVMFLYRAEYYKIMQYEDGTPTQGAMEVIIAKNRNGACDTVQLKFMGKYSKVSDFDYTPHQYVSKESPKSYKDFQVSRQEHEEDSSPF